MRRSARGSGGDLPDESAHAGLLVSLQSELGPGTFRNKNRSHRRRARAPDKRGTARRVAAFRRARYQDQPQVRR
ncbi:hypothetical protein [Pseudomonas sp. MWU13-2100]|uniref:hypothetical protein n=1 Tax=Pseudomonas sp. MWU13-2100 TaxID=2935075 RepID=UPI00399A1624